MVLPVAYMVCTPDGAAADRERVRPALLLAVVPERLVSASVGLPWL